MGYTLKLEDRVKKAERCLFEADVPRPSVVVIINFMKQGAQKDYRNMEDYFEVYRRPPSGAKEETKVYETGVSALNKVAHKELHLANSVR